MNNIRKLKKKKPASILNPEQLAQQKLFEISRFQDQEAKKEQSDIFLQTKFHEEKLAPIQRMQKTERSASQIPLQNQKTRVPSILSLKSYKRKSGEIRAKQQLPLTHYVVIDERDKVYRQTRQRMTRYECANLLRQKLSMRKMKSRSVPIASRSYELHRQQPIDQIRSLRGNVVYAIQVKNAKFFNKYPSFIES